MLGKGELERKCKYKSVKKEKEERKDGEGKKRKNIRKEEKENKWLFSKNKLSFINKAKWIKFKDERKDRFKNILIN